ncbi:MAG: hypothetical protein JNM51_10555 [Bacteroidia bacterium]|nr:hypothetical protein [Bacteroidia bacterium]
MKTLTSLICILVLITTSLRANGGSDELIKNLSQKVKNNLKVPESLTQKRQSQKITFYFLVNDYGDVIEVNAKTNNLEAKRDLEKQFKQLNFKGFTPNSLGIIDVNFIVY